MTLAGILLVAGCEKKAALKADRRAVTTEIVAAAQRITAHAAQIMVRPEMQYSLNGVSPTSTNIDDIHILLRDSSELGPLRRALGEIARRHKLSLTQGASAKGFRYDFFSQGQLTHAIEIALSAPAGDRAETSAATPRVSCAQGGPRLAIIIDDMGRDRAAIDAIVRLRIPVTISVLPHLALSATTAEEANRYGDQVLLHLPMEPENEAAPSEQTELRVGMSQQEVETALAGMLATVPGAAGVNNHEGSRATADETLMTELMPALRERGLFYLDSRTTAATVAYDVAERSGVRAASRKVFLDDVPTKQAVLARLNQAARDAIRDGSSIAIGHPYRGTIEALADAGPQLASRQIRLVLVSDLVH
jgi:polysaccharide deacetylase 2 family uncharacterized protein YibQ